MTLPPALLQRLAQRGLVQKQKKDLTVNTAPAENEEVIAEDYDEMESEQQQDNDGEYQFSSLYDNETTARKRGDNFWLERMRARMGEGNSYAGYKSCPNKYNIYHKCTLFCVNRWEDGHTEPSREYMRRYKRMLRKYPLPKGWVEIFDPGCGVYYFANETDGVVSWLSPTHPKSHITKSAAVLRRQAEENNGEDSDSEEEEEEESDSDSDERSTRKSTRRSRSPSMKLSVQDFPSLHESMSATTASTHKQKSRESDRNISRSRREREHRDRSRERDREGERYNSGRRGRGHTREESDIVDPMDPSSYSDIPRGKWSDGLQTNSEKIKKSEPEALSEKRKRHEEPSDQEDQGSNSEAESERSF